MQKTRMICLAGIVHLGVLLASCGESAFISPTPSPPFRVPSSATHTLSGIVTERFSGRPVEGATIFVWPHKTPSGGWPPAGLKPALSDAHGRYVISGLPAVGLVWVKASDTGRDAFLHGFVQQCGAPVTIAGEATLDLVVGSTADLTALNSKPTYTATATRVVSGTIYELTGTGRRPASHVWVGWEAGLDIVVAETRSDSAGHYVLCGLPTDRIHLFAAPTYRSVVYTTVDAGMDAVIDFEVMRR